MLLGPQAVLAAPQAVTEQPNPHSSLSTNLLGKAKEQTGWESREDRRALAGDVFQSAVLERRSWTGGALMASLRLNAVCCLSRLKALGRLIVDGVHAWTGDQGEGEGSLPGEYGSS